MAAEKVKKIKIKVMPYDILKDPKVLRRFQLTSPLLRHKIHSILTNKLTCLLEKETKCWKMMLKIYKIGLKY
jgi:hypothetical protein